MNEKRNLTPERKKEIRTKMAIKAAENYFRSLGYKCEPQDDPNPTDTTRYYKPEYPTGQAAFGIKEVYCMIEPNGENVGLSTAVVGLRLRIRYELRSSGGNGQSLRMFAVVENRYGAPHHVSAFISEPDYMKARDAMADAIQEDEFQAKKTEEQTS